MEGLHATHLISLTLTFETNLDMLHRFYVGEHSLPLSFLSFFLSNAICQIEPNPICTESVDVIVFPYLLLWSGEALQGERGICHHQNKLGTHVSVCAELQDWVQTSQQPSWLQCTFESWSTMQTVANHAKGECLGWV